MLFRRLRSSDANGSDIQIGYALNSARSVRNGWGKFYAQRAALHASEAGKIAKDALTRHRLHGV